ncbi:GNAT family N-acetyltransferase [Phytohabitans sp. LJ34]|uniref:GNAT family N-acetyltransferase n=1 Tax=Phytohabitans sp. LJ34 TaxID=3452217 RepID=UPI003F8BDDF9
MDLDLDGLRVRTLVAGDADLVVEATRAERRPALWGPRPAGPYSQDDARAALRAWEAEQVSYGVLDGPRLVAALGLMPSGPGAAELAYWVRPERRREGLGRRAVRAVTAWAHAHAGLTRVWLEIDPDNAPSLRLAESAGYRYEERMPRHCRTWAADDPAQDVWHDCLIWTHEASGRRR